MVEIEPITDVADKWESCKEKGSNAKCKEGGSDVVVIDARKEVPKTLGQAGQSKGSSTCNSSGTATRTDMADKKSERGITAIFPPTKKNWRSSGRVKQH